MSIGGIPSAEAFGTPRIRTSRPDEWLRAGLQDAFARLASALATEDADAARVWPSLYETLVWAITNAERRGIRHDLRTAVEFVRDGVVHGTVDAIEPQGRPSDWHWRLSEHFEPPTAERNRGRAWRRKRAAYDRELAGKPVVNAIKALVDELIAAR